MICQRWTTATHICRLWISATDYLSARLASQSSTSFVGEVAARVFALQGLSDPQALEGIKGKSGYYTKLVPDLPLNYGWLMEGLALHQRIWPCARADRAVLQHTGVSAELEDAVNPSIRH